MEREVSLLDVLFAWNDDNVNSTRVVSENFMRKKGFSLPDDQARYSLVVTTTISDLYQNGLI